MDSARALTGARYGGIVTLDQSGQFQDFVTSGLTPEQHQALLDLPEEGLRLFEFLSTHPEPLRLRDFSAHATSLGLTHDFMQVGAFLGTPICHRGAHIGHFYLAEREDGRAFTDEDEETLGAVHRSSGAGPSQRPPAPQRAAGPGRLGGPDRHLAGGRRGLRCAVGAVGVNQPGGEPDRRRPA